jgi:EAL domain-containing protein (putative c-di-GMP-specific phosphodiesterase class I)
MVKTNPNVPKGNLVGTVLVVDDDPCVLEWLRQSIGKSTYTVTTCSTPSQVLELVARQNVLAVVSDISMPEMSGIELVRLLHELDPILPVVLVTGVPCIESAAEAVDIGAFMYLLKPVDATVLSMTVERAVHHYCASKLERQALAQLGVDDQTSNLFRLQTHFDAALATMWMAYQPIMKVSDRSVFGYEAFLRTGDPILREPKVLLYAAERLGTLTLLGRTIHERAVSPLRQRDGQYTLFVNLHPQDLQDVELWKEDSALVGLASHVVLEITERASIENLEEIKPKVVALRALGFRIAIDDVGAGYAGLNSITVLEPDFIKLDLVMVRDIDKVPLKQKLVATMTALGRNLGHSVVAEGVETRHERDMLMELGCDYLQGNLFARPQRDLSDPTWPEARPDESFPFHAIDTGAAQHCSDGSQYVDCGRQSTNRDPYDGPPIHHSTPGNRSGG